MKKLRCERKISQSELASRLNTTVKTVSHWETGYSEPSLAQALEIAEFFQISIDELLRE